MIGSGVFIYYFLSTIFVNVAFSVLKGSSSLFCLNMPSAHISVTVTNDSQLIQLLTFPLLSLMRLFDVFRLFYAFDVHD